MKLLNQAYNRDNYLDFLADKFNFAKHLAPIVIDNNDVESLQQLGTVTSQDGKKLPVFEIHIKPNTQLSRNRVQLRNLVAKQISSEDGALAVYVDAKNKQWRFSFIAIEYRFTNDGIQQEQTASKRFTYLLGENTQTRTAQDRFGALNKQSTLQDLKTAFSVEELNKEFYDKLYRWYEKAQCEVVFPNDERTDNHSQTSLIRLLMRLLFIWFIKEKGLIKADLFDKDKLQTLIDYEQPSSFYKAILQNLFFATLNRPVTERSFRTTTNGKPNQTNYLATNIYRYQNYFNGLKEADIIALFDQAPFLNGGLFECLDREASDAEKQAYDNDKTIRPIGSAIRIDGFSDRADNELVFHNHLFFKDTIFNDNKQDDKQDLGLIDLFNQYQFTVEESTPLDVEVALDPELLGKVFENLLASYNPETGQQARKATGSFYTPREIVNYMVDESLKQHFHQHTDLTDKQINALFVDAEFTEQENALNKQQTKALIYAIDGLKILDPAVGSGAYPMGILQRLVLILEKVDAENTHFKQQQIDKAEQIPDEASCASAIAAIEQVFSQQNQHNAYGKKLMLIENCIYGVDIQPIAIQICKLRFFISLTIEQSPNKSKADNYGIKALPNLETKFIVANSLLPLGEMPKQKGIFDTGIEELQTKLAQVRHKHFSAKTLTTKRKYRDKDKDLREQMLEELTKSGITPAVEASMKRIVHWDLYNQNAIADWFDPKWMFGVDSFDIVIGNPPYIKEYTNKEAFNGFRTSKYYQGKMDLWYGFACVSLDLLKQKGIECFIAQNNWTTSAGASIFRNKVLRETEIKSFTDFRNYKVFKSAGIQTMTYLLKKEMPSKCYPLKYSLLKDDSIKQKQLSDFLSFNADDDLGEKYTLNFDSSLYYGSLITFNNPRIDNVLNSVLNNDIDYLMENEVANGIHPHYDFVTKKMLLNLDSTFSVGDGIFGINHSELQELNLTEEEKKFLKRYYSDTSKFQKYYPQKSDDKFIIYTDSSYNKAGSLDRFPNLKKHLDKFQGIITSDNKPYGLHRARKEKFFIGEKIAVQRKCPSEPIFTYVDFDSYLSATFYVIKTSRFNLKYLTALLNSKLVAFWLRYKGKMQGNNYQIDKEPLVNIPIPKISKSAQQPFIALVDKILTAKQQAQDTRTLETQIDQMVYRLYNLSEEEVRIVENNATPDLVIPAKAGIQ